MNSKISGQLRRTRGSGRPCHCAGKCNHETRERHERKSAPSVEQTRGSTEDNETKMQAAPSFSSFPSVQNLRVISSRLATERTSDPAQETQGLRGSRRVRFSTLVFPLVSHVILNSIGEPSGQITV